jgi:hypothetical protein
VALKGTQFMQPMAQSMSASDQPSIYLPKALPMSGNMASENVIWNLSMYVVVTVDQAPTNYVPEAYLPWTFNASGTIAGNTWTPAGAGVTYRTAAGANVAVNNAQWVATPGAPVSFTISAPRFNSLIQPNEKNQSPIRYL